MKYITFKREDNDFKDIIADTKIKKVRVHISWVDHLLLGFDDEDAAVISFLSVKYCSDICEYIVPDRTPVSGIDYYPVQLYE